MAVSMADHLQKQEELIEDSATPENVVTRYGEEGRKGYTASLTDNRIRVEVFGGQSFAVDITDTGYEIVDSACEGEGARDMAGRFVDNVLVPRDVKPTPPEVRAQAELQEAYEQALDQDPFSAALEVGRAAENARNYLEQDGLQPTSLRIDAGPKGMSDIRVHYGEEGRSRSTQETGIDSLVVRTRDGTREKTTQLAYGMVRILLQDSGSRKDSISTGVGYKPGAAHHEMQDVVATEIVEAFDRIYDLDFCN